MTDKEVIIDGINVAGCERLILGERYGYDDENECSPIVCKNSPNCLYKQFQRLQAENEELNNELQTGKDNHAYAVELEKDIDRYKQALEEIKEKAQENNDLLQGYHLKWANNKLILEIINEVLND